MAVRFFGLLVKSEMAFPILEEDALSFFLASTASYQATVLKGAFFASACRITLAFAIFASTASSPLGQKMIIPIPSIAKPTQIAQ